MNWGRMHVHMGEEEKKETGTGPLTQLPEPSKYNNTNILIKTN